MRECADARNDAATAGTTTGDRTTARASDSARDSDDGDVSDRVT